MRLSPDVGYIKLKFIGQSLYSKTIPMMSYQQQPMNTNMAGMIPQRTHFQIVSDLHIDTSMDTSTIDWRTMFTKNAETLIIVGDVGRLENYDNYKIFMESICKEYKDVYLVAGNHEYYSHTVPYTFLNTDLHKLDREIPNLTVLDNSYVDLPGNIRLYGTVLWSQVSSREATRKILPMTSVSGGITGTNTWMNMKHFNDLYMLENNIALANRDKKRLIVVSHYAPCYEGCLRDDHLVSSDRFWYANKLDNMLTRDNMYVWIYGHTHVNSDRLTAGDTRVVSNQYGGKDYNPKKVLSIKHV